MSVITRQASSLHQTTDRSPLRVGLTMPRRTVYRSTDRDYIYGRFTRLAERHPLVFIPPASRAYTAHWNGEYVVRRLMAAAGVQPGDQAFTPPFHERGSDMVFSYGLYPRSTGAVPVLWEQTFAPQLDYPGDEWRRRVRRACTRAAHEATRVVTATDVSAGWFAEIFPEAADKVRVAPYFLPDLKLISDEALTEKSVSKSKLRVLFVGKEARRKGLESVVAAWQLLTPSARDGISMRVVSQMLDGKVRLPSDWDCTPFVDDMQKEMQSAHVLVFPTRHEAYGLVLVEAMAAGCAILTTFAPIQRSIVGEDCGVYADPRDPVSIASALNELVSDRAQTAAKMKAARARFQARYAPGLVGDLYAQLLWETAGRTHFSATLGR